MTIPLQVFVSDDFDYYNRFIMQDARFGYVRKDNVWRDGFMEPEMKAALARFQALYREGLIDPGFFANTTYAARLYLTNGQVGFMEYWAGEWADTLDASAKMVNPRARIAAIPPISEARYLQRPGFYVLAITAGAKNPGWIFKTIFGTMFDKGEGQMLFTYGVKGIHWKVGENGYSMLPFQANPKVLFEYAFITPALTFNGWKLPIDLPERRRESIDIFNARHDQLPLMPAQEISREQDYAIGKLKKEIFTLIVTGELSVDEGMALYREEAGKTGLPLVLDKMNGRN